MSSPANADRMPQLDRYEEILRVATDLFCRFGVHAVSTRQIAAAVGISQPSLYAHFHSIREIQEHVSRRAFLILEAHARDAVKDGVDPHIVLKKIIQAYLRFGLENPDAYRIAFLLEHSPKPVKSEKIDELDHPGPRAFAVMRNSVANVRPELDATRLEILTQSLWATLHGLLALLIARPAFPWADHGDLIDQHSRSAYLMATQL